MGLSKIYEEPSCLIVWIPFTHREDSQGLWTYYTNKNTASLYFKEQKLDKNFKKLSDFWNSMVKKKLVKLLMCEPVLPFKKKKGTQKWKPEK